MASMALAFVAGSAWGADYQTLRYLEAPPVVLQPLASGEKGQPVKVAKVVIHPRDGEAWAIVYEAAPIRPLGAPNVPDQFVPWKGGDQPPCRGAAPRVRIRWSDRSESLGEVLRSDVRRDVALIKVDPHGRAALPLRMAAPQAGDTEFAIGMPLEKDFQNTLTKGLVAAERIYDGQRFIQSDVAVDHGNSGGPLLDENRQVVGITGWGYAPDGVSHNLNFFISIDDALRIVALSPGG